MQSRVPGCCRSLSQSAPTPRGAPCGGSKTDTAACVDEDACCVRAAAQRLPAVFDDPSLAAIAIALPAWTTFKTVALAMHGNHTVSPTASPTASPTISPTMSPTAPFDI